MNLYDMTRGNYAVHRTVSYSEFPNSQLVFDTRVRSVSAREWSTSIEVSGTYDGPTDVIGVEDYQIEWTTDSKTLAERGSATLQLAAGGSVHSTWTSTITPDAPRFAKFPRGGESVRVTVSAFKVEGNKMSYDWTGTVEPAKEGKP